MKAAVLNSKKNISIEEKTSPKLLHPRDVIIKVTLTSICGTDMHPYRGQLKDFTYGSIMGHEFTGIIEEIGSDVKDYCIGDRVVVSDIIACGECWYCKKELHYHCENASLFGYGEVVGEYFPGGQAERVRVPFADQVLIKIPDKLSDEKAIFVGDILSTGYACAIEANIKEGDCVLVIGGGPVGLMAVLSAQLFRPSKIFVVEPNVDRHEIAKIIGAHPITPQQMSIVIDYTEKRGVDVVLEAVGTDSALQTAFDIIRSKGNVVCVGAHHSKQMPFNTENAFAKELSLKFIVGNPLKYGAILLEKIKGGDLDPSIIISHRLEFKDIEKAYEMFDSQKALKIVLNLEKVE
ncbi:hypothetical protein RW25_27710 [Bacillus sp. L_1B0_8]|uniref:alcohol dehydrogenase catalytic domain-containing protein n=1 Tax=unclassified Bacillus (in: firmicutes) TaxID=185979 RepID=UPI0005B6D035|nr:MULTISPECIES: alcohol dehydrogenase catalytic domain-containing protein [unclassified Bacillus (in: firmicutes)]KIQ78520.1 hypothetical protein RW25_27710 [Bacillus sp. L_1B0_8]KIQ78633.1 hypothetical protein RT27_29340 [Bacillus sp. L_1B0_5]